MSDGKIAEQGTYKSLIKNNKGALFQLISEHVSVPNSQEKSENGPTHPLKSPRTLVKVIIVFPISEFSQNFHYMSFSN